MATTPDRRRKGQDATPTRGGIRGFVRRHPWPLAIGALLVVGGAVFVLVYFQPQKLFLNQRVQEAVPSVAAPAQATPGGQVASSLGASSGGAVQTLASGAFRSLEHATTGRALILRLPDGTRILRFENLSTSNGPDLHVYLSQVPAGPDANAYGVRFVDLGKLKGNIGSQNYALPANLDPARYKSAVVWCKRFSVGFGVAPLG